MITRIVKMTFKAEHIDDFTSLFEDRKKLIRHFPGCLHLELWQDEHHPEIFFTYSHWETESDLEHYRFSPFFKETWTLTKKLFAQKAEAYSINQRIVIE